MLKKHVDLLTILSGISALAGSTVLTTFGESVEAAFPGYGKRIVGLITLLSGAAGLLLWVYYNRTPTNTIQVRDHDTGAVVPVATVASPADSLRPPVPPA